MDRGGSRHDISRPSGDAGSGSSSAGFLVVPQRRPRPPKLYRISEIVEYTGVSRQTIHNYTTMGLITECRRTEGGHRLYAEDVFDRLDLIAELKRQRKTMREIRELFAAMEGD